MRMHASQQVTPIGDKLRKYDLVGWATSWVDVKIFLFETEIGRSKLKWSENV